MRQAGRGGRRRVSDAAGQLRLRGFHHHGRHPDCPLCLGAVSRSGRSSPLRQEKGLSPKVLSPLRPLRPPLLLALRAASPSALSQSARRRGVGSESGRGGGGAFIWRLGKEPGRRRKRRRKGPPGTSSRGGCLGSSSRWPGLMSSAANHLARGPEAGGMRCADNGQGRAVRHGVGEP